MLAILVYYPEKSLAYSPFSPESASYSRDIFEVKTGSIIYNIPKNYIIHADNSYPVLRVTYPDFLPLTDATRNRLYGKNSFRNRLDLRVGSNRAAEKSGSPTTKRDLLNIWENDAQKLYAKSIDKKLGYTTYSAGPVENEVVNYAKTWHGKLYAFTCLHNGTSKFIIVNCDDTVILNDGNIVKFMFSDNLIDKVPEIEAGIESLFDRFRQTR